MIEEAFGIIYAMISLRNKSCKEYMYINHWLYET